MSKKFFALLLIMLIALFSFMTINVANAAGDTCTWNGASDDWNSPSNWNCTSAGFSVPSAGDDVIFPAIAANKNIIIDDALDVNDVDITGDYTFTTTDATVFDMEGPSVNLDIDGDVTFDVNVEIQTTTGTNFSADAEEGNVVTFSDDVEFGSDGDTDFGANSTGVDRAEYIFNGAVSGATNQFIATDEAIVRMDGTTHTYTADTVGAESDGLFVCMDTTCFGNNANDIYMGGGVVEIDISNTFTNQVVTSTTTPDVSALYASENISITGTVDVNDNLAVAQFGTGKSIQFTNTIDVNTGSIIEAAGISAAQNTVRFSTSVTGTGIVVKANSVRLELENASTFTGEVLASDESIISAENVASFGNAANLVRIENTASVQSDLASSGTIPNDFEMIGSGNTGVNQGALVNGSNTIQTTFSGDIELLGITLIGDAGTCSTTHFTDFTGVISGNFALYVYANQIPCRIYLSGTSPNTFAGALTLRSGYLSLNKNLAAPGDLSLSPDGSTVSTTIEVVDGYDNAIGGRIFANVTSDSEYINFQNNETVRELGMDGPGMVLICKGGELVVDQDSDTTFEGTFGNGGACSPTSDPRVIEKQGTGTLTLTADDAADADTAIRIEGGVVAVNGNREATEVVIVGGTLKGSGKVGDVEGQSGSLNAGNSPGCLATGDLSMQSGFVFVQEINGGTACTSFDQVNVTGNVALGNATLNLQLGTNPPVGTSFKIIQSTGTISGTFNNLSNGDVFEVNGIKFKISYNASDVTLSVVDPSSAVTSTAGQLPATGLSAINFILISMTIAALGVAFLTLTTRRRRTLLK